MVSSLSFLMTPSVYSSIWSLKKTSSTHAENKHHNQISSNQATKANSHDSGTWQWTVMMIIFLFTSKKEPGKNLPWPTVASPYGRTQPPLSPRMLLTHSAPDPTWFFFSFCVPDFTQLPTIPHGKREDTLYNKCEGSPSGCWLFKQD